MRAHLPAVMDHHLLLATEEQAIAEVRNAAQRTRHRYGRSSSA